MFGGVVRGDALHRGDDDLAGALLSLVAGFALDLLCQADGIAIGFVANSFQQLGFCLRCGHAADALEGGHVFLVGAGEFLAGALEFSLAVQELSIALLEHVGAHVELLVAGKKPALEGGEFAALGSGFVFGLALEPHLLVLGGEDQLLLLGPCLGDDAGGLLLRALDGLVGDYAAAQEPKTSAHKSSHDDGGHKGDHIHMNLPPTQVG
jgi:hypothetical protein